MMILGMVFRKIGWIDEVFASKMNKFVFLVPLPLLVFEDLATADFSQVWDTKVVLFCFIVTLLSIGISILLSIFLIDKSDQGEFIQASYRSSAALLGIALIQNIYGDAGMAPLMIIGSVPLYNIMAVVVLSFFQPQRQKLTKEVWKKTIYGILTNPIIIGIVLGLIWSIFQLPLPNFIHKTVSSLAATASPLGLLAMGASFSTHKVLKKMKPIVLASFMKLFGFCILFLPIAIILGFHTEKLIAILVMLGSSTTVSCYIMAKNMNHEGVLTSGIVMLTTLMSGFSITLWLFILKSFQFI
jgi:hypothetical protein